MKDRILNALMLCAVGAALAFTWLRQPPAQAPVLHAAQTAPGESTPHPAVTFRQLRQTERQQEADLLRSLSQSDGWYANQQKDAADLLQDVTSNRETELAVEGAMAGKGYGNALCVCRKDKVSVFCDQQLMAADAQMILDLILEISGIPAENIRISGY